MYIVAKNAAKNSVAMHNLILCGFWLSDPLLTNSVESSAVASLYSGNTYRLYMFIALNVTSQERDNSCLDLMCP